MVTTAQPIPFEDFFAALDYVQSLRAESEHTSKSFLTPVSATPAKALRGNSLPNVELLNLMNEANWVQFRDSGISPLKTTELTTTEQTRREFLTGAALLRKLTTVKPQMLLVADMLATGHKFNGVIMPRRSSKTTSILCVLIGRIALRPDYFVGFSLATTQAKTAARFRQDVMKPLERLFPDPKNRPFRLYWSNGGERVEFPHGSYIAALSPDGDSFRSDAYDALLIDEGGEANPDLGADILSAVLPTFDTRPGAQLVIAGTAAKYRSGNILWDALNNPKAGVLRYTVPDTVTDDQLAAWEPTEDHPEACVKTLVETSHPGVGTLTTLEDIHDNFESFTREQFALEYLGLFGEIGANTGLIDATKWAACGHGAELPELPTRFSLAIATHPDQTHASIVAAWRDNGRAQILMLENRTGVKWLAQKALQIARKYNTPIVYDSGSPTVLNAVETFNRARPKPNLQPQGFMAVKKAAALLLDEIERGTLDHWRQPDLDNAAKVVVKRKAGVNGWALGRDPKRPGDDITPLEAAALALLVFDETRPRARARTQVRA